VGSSPATGTAGNPPTVSACNARYREGKWLIAMPKKGKSRGLRRQRILIVDDERVATHVLGRLLRRHGYITAEVNDSTKAGPLARRFRPDVALLDLHMPWKDGRELAADFEADNSLRSMPVIFITADVFEKNETSAPIPILYKPFSIDDLLARVREAAARNFEDAGQEIYAESGIG
jgi:CheY-like chemotaxis protein